MSDMQAFNNPPELKIADKKFSGKKKLVIISVIVVFLITGFAALGSANDFIDKHRPGGKGPLGFLMKIAMQDLNLTDQQKQEVEKIKNEIQAKMEQNREDRKNDMTEMEQMFRSDNFDKSKALELMKKHDEKRDEMRSFMLDQTAKFHAILTPDQRNKAADKLKEFREKRKENRDKWNKEDGRK